MQGDLQSPAGHSFHMHHHTHTHTHTHTHAGTYMHINTSAPLPKTRSSTYSVFMKTYFYKKNFLSPYPWSLHAHQQDHSHHPSSSALLSVSRSLKHPQDPASSMNNKGVQTLTGLGCPSYTPFLFKRQEENQCFF